MLPVCVHSRSGVPPGRVDDLTGDLGAVLDKESLITAGQAMSWQSTFTCGAVTAVPLTPASAMIFKTPGPADPQRWHDRFTRGLAHRMAGELTIAAVTTELLGHAAMGDTNEDAVLLGSAIDALGRLLADLTEAQRPEEGADRIVTDAKRTHEALLGVVRQRVHVRRQKEFTVHTVRSVTKDRNRADLERAVARVGLPWPSRAGQGIGGELGLARWRAAMQAHGHQMWSRTEREDVLVTELWLRDPPEARGSGSRIPSGS
ncbi:hypothetical protein K8Z49_27510 [Actinomadura madurae]|uniref:Uncharacterized protein n=1 Tax=Actinomadura madurae TaxID=1993 RepID=A0A1I5YP23_9ACTN|nr:hypothetical protein [Actinomadura madurae]SFQ45943.1 hypothetical protein SAMN04489713_13531 [Actinomadura madurae]